MSLLSGFLCVSKKKDPVLQGWVLVGRFPDSTETIALSTLPQKDTPSSGTENFIITDATWNSIKSSVKHIKIEDPLNGTFTFNDIDIAASNQVMLTSNTSLKPGNLEMYNSAEYYFKHQSGPPIYNSLFPHTDGDRLVITSKGPGGWLLNESTPPSFTDLAGRSYEMYMYIP